MSNHTLAVVLTFALILSTVLIIVDDQPKPRHTPAWIVRLIVSLAAFPLWIILLVRAW